MAKRSGGKKKASGKLPGAGARIVLLKGKDAALRAIKTDRMVETLRGAFGEVEVIRYDGSTGEPADALDECRSMDLMMRHKAVVVDQADQFVKGDARAIVERYAQAPAEGATLILRAETWHKGNLDKQIEKVGAIVDCDPPSPAQATKWAAARCAERHGAEIEPHAAAALVERLGVDMGRIDTELAKLAAAAAAQSGDERPTITADHVRDLVGRTREEEVWAIQSRLLGGAEEAVGGVRDALGPWRQPPVLVMFACVDLARKLHTASAMLASGARPMEARKAARAWGEGGDALLRAAQRLDPARLARLFDRAVEWDKATKTGRLSPDLAPELLAIEFASLTRR